MLITPDKFPWPQVSCSRVPLVFLSISLVVQQHHNSSGWCLCRGTLNKGSLGLLYPHSLCVFFPYVLLGAVVVFGLESSHCLLRPAGLCAICEAKDHHHCWLMAWAFSDLPAPSALCAAGIP